jgi:pimeloyl-ACP methyl ester carboxylesterase
MKQTIGYRNNHTLSYAEYGDKNGFPILIQHGLIASIRDSSLFTRLLDLGTRLICIARPGYGDSSPYEMKNMADWGEIVSVLTDHLELSHFDVFGISSGAPYSYSIANQLPHQVRNTFILSGTPALYDADILSCWPYEVNKHASMAEMQSLARQLFFSNLSQQDLEKEDIQDSIQNNCFGIAQDFRLRCNDWGFELADVPCSIIMRHSRADDSVPFITAQLTSKLLPNCRLDIRENDAHFSQPVLNDFIETIMAEHYSIPSSRL